MSFQPKFVAYEDMAFIVPPPMTHVQFSLMVPKHYGKPVSAGFFHVKVHNGISVCVLHGESKSLNLSADSRYTLAVSRNLNSWSIDNESMKEAVQAVLSQVKV